MNAMIDHFSSLVGRLASLNHDWLMFSPKSSTSKWRLNCLVKKAQIDTLIEEDLWEF